MWSDSVFINPRKEIVVVRCALPRMPRTVGAHYRAVLVYPGHADRRRSRVCCELARRLKLLNATSQQYAHLDSDSEQGRRHDQRLCYRVRPSRYPNILSHSSFPNHVDIAIPRVNSQSLAPAMVNEIRRLVSVNSVPPLRSVTHLLERCAVRASSPSRLS